MKIKRPDFVDFILKDINSKVLKDYIKDLEKRISNAIDLIEETKGYYLDGIDEELKDMLKGENYE